MTNQWGVMSEYYREQHPLLCEEASEEELYSPRYFRRVHPTTYRGRARITHKGAATILTRWPEHWTSFLTYWWIAFGMISLITFIVYNSLFAFSMLPSTNTKPVKPIVSRENMNTSLEKSSLPNVYIHMFADPREDIELDQYMPYIDIIAGTFLDLKFNFIVVINDTNVGWMSAEENNELALNMLLTNDKYVYQKETRSHNINIEYRSLSVFMDSSPLKKFWRTLPHQLIEFLARTVSIWDKGGVAFNPDILTPRFQHTLYIEKLQKILNEYAHTNKLINLKVTNKSTKTVKKSKVMNNIGDIINALEMEDISSNAYARQTLSEAEDRDIQIIRHERHAPTTVDTKSKKYFISNTLEPSDNTILETSYYTSGASEKTITNTNINSLETNNNSSKISLLPLLFLEFLFNNKDIRSKPTKPVIVNRTRKSIITPSSTDDKSINKNTVKETGKDTEYILKPVIVSPPSTYNKSEFYNITNSSHSNETNRNSEANKLTIDLKGNIIATDIACHAFLGTIYSNVVHHNQEETITDFIIAELTIFCKGLLSSCMGIDLILL